MRKKLIVVPVLVLVVSAGLWLGLDVMHHLTEPDSSTTESPPEPERTLLDRVTLSSWVPVHVLYDPPGNGSSAWLSVTGTGRQRVQFCSNSPGLRVIGSFTGGVFGGVSTPENDRVHGIVAIGLNQTWEVYNCSLDDSQWYEAVLVAAENYGKGIFHEEGLASRNIWIENMIGTQGQHDCPWHVSPGDTHEVIFEYSGFEPTDTKAGYNITLYGMEFSIRVMLSMGGRSLQTTYTFHDPSRPLNFRITSNGAIKYQSEGKYEYEGMLIWFDC